MANLRIDVLKWLREWYLSSIAGVYISHDFLIAEIALQSRSSRLGLLRKVNADLGES